MEEKIHEILQRFAKRMKFDPEALREANRKQAMVPEGATPIDPAGTAPGLVVPADDQVVIVLPGPAARAAGHVAAGARDRAGAGGAGPRRAARGRSRSACSASRSPSWPRRCARSRTRPTWASLEITTCLRGGELITDVRHRRRRARRPAEALRRGLEERLGQWTYSEAGETIEEVVASACSAAHARRGRVLHGGLLAARLTKRPGASRVLQGRRRVLLERGQGGPARRRPRADRGARRGLARRSPRRWPTARWSASAPTSPARSPGSPARRRHRGEAGRLRLLLRQELASGELLPRDIVLPGDRDDIRDRSAMVAMHLIRYLLEGREPPR